MDLSVMKNVLFGGQALVSQYKTVRLGIPVT